MKIRTDFVTNSSSQSYIAVTIFNPELARLCKKYKIKLDVRGDVVSYNYNDLEGAADFIKPEAKDFVDWFLHFIDFEGVADKKACEIISENRKSIEEAFIKSVIVVSHINEAEGCYWEENRNRKEIELKGFDDQSWDTVWNDVDHDEIAKLYDGDDIDNITPSNYPLRQLISDNWGFQWGLHSRDDKDQIFIKRMIKQYGTKRIITDAELSRTEDMDLTDLESRLFEYSGELEEAVSIELEEAEKEWKVKIAKKAKKAEVSNYSGNDSIVTVPAFIDGIPVKKLGVLTQNPERIEEVIIPHTVESLVSKTFKGCVNLNKLVISENTEVPLGAFDKCDKLGDKNGCIVKGGVLFYITPQSEVVISDGVKEIPDGFTCRKIEKIVFPESLVRIGKKAFEEHKKLANLEFPPNLKEIDDGAFGYCDGLFNIEFNEGLERLRGFMWCSTHTPVELNIPNTVKEIGSFWCSHFNPIKLSTSIKEIPYQSFCNCIYLEEIEIPNGVKSIGKSAFEACANLQNVYIPDSVEEIGSGAFKDCSRAKFHYSPHKMTFPADAFTNCDGLTDDKGVLVFGDTVIQYKGNDQFVEIPSNIKRIGDSAFKDSKTINNIVFANPDVQIGETPNMETFKGCSGLADEDGFVIVNNCLFDYVGPSKIIEIPESVEYIASNCFSLDNVSRVIVPAGVKDMGKHAFADKEIEIEFKESVPLISNEWINMIERWDSLSQKRTLQWKQEKMPDGFYIVGDCLLYCDKDDSSIEIPSGIKTIAGKAIRKGARHCVIHIPEGVEYIGLDAFVRYPAATTDIYLPKTIKRIENLPEGEVIVYVHEGVNFESVLIDKSDTNYTVKVIGKDSVEETKESLFIVGKMKNGGLRIKKYNGPTGKDVNVYIPSEIEGKTVTCIGKDAFADMHFERIEMPDTVEIIDNGAFRFSKFSFVKLSSNLREIGTDAFGWCPQFSFVDFPESLETVKSGAFRSIVAVLRGNTKLSYNNEVDIYYADSENVVQEVKKTQDLIERGLWSGSVELRPLAELEDKYKEYRNCGVVKRDSNGWTTAL